MNARRWPALLRTPSAEGSQPASSSNCLARDASVDWTATTLLDRRILLFTAASALLTGVLTGVIPALQAGRTEVTGALKAGGREGGHRTTRLRAALLVVQAALSVMLLIGSGLFLRSLRNVNAVDMGYQPGRLLFVSTDYRGTRLSPADRNALQQRLLERARAMPGVQSAAATFATPFWASLVEDVFVPGRGSVNGLGALYLNRVTETISPRPAPPSYGAVP